MTKRKQFSAEFKGEAVRLLDTSKKQPSDLARELGIRRNQLYKWKDQLSRRGKRAFPGNGGRLESSDEVTRLREELERVKEERDILKKAAAYFSKELK